MLSAGRRSGTMGGTVGLGFTGKELWDETQRLRMMRTGRLPDSYPGDQAPRRGDEVVLHVREGDGVVRKFVAIERDGLALAFLAKDATEGGHNFEAVASTGRVDRQRDRVSPKGWSFDTFRKNPVILASHDAGAFPVAKAENVRVADNAVRLLGLFPPPGTSRRSDEARALVNAGILRALSVGFRALASPTPNEFGGYDYATQELLEVSLVSLPANPDALITRVW
jgi:HK97 family phage prohead protease